MNQRQYSASVQDILHHLENIFKVCLYAVQ